jgi:hypothetical protein
MKTRITASFIFTVILNGCTYTTSLYYNDQDTSFVKTSKEIQEHTQSRQAQISLANGEVVSSSNVGVSGESVTMNCEDDTLVKKMSTRDIKRISITDREKGFTSGLGYGFLTGAAACGALIGLDKLFYPHNFGHPGGLEYLLIPLGGIAGAFVGGVCGLLNGYTDIYLFEEKKK